MSRSAIASGILERYASGARSFVGSSLDGEVHDFSCANLENADFSRSFIFADFRNANLVGANFSEANVKTCDFTGANLRGALFKNAAIDDAIFNGANLDGASFEGASEQGYIYAKHEFPSHTAA